MDRGPAPGFKKESSGAVQCYQVSSIALGQVERGRRNISLHNILKLAEGLQLDPSELVKGLKVERE